MTQASINFDQPAETMTAAVAQFFRLNAGVWISALDVMRVGGALAWRTEISRCRKAPYLMTIENRTRRVGRKLYSEYRLVP
jgi:hypothetical protein